jgi:predicted RNA-binding Zn ribbon-like protein
MPAIPTPENRPPAPGALGVLQEFMNSGHLAGRVTEQLAAEVRRRREQGVSRAAVASEFGLGQKFVSATGRGVRLSDDLATPESAEEWLGGQGLTTGSTSVTEAGLARLRELRELLRTLAEGNNGREVPPEVLRSLDDMAARAPLVVQFDSGPVPSLRPVDEGIDGAIGRLLAIVYEAMGDGSFQRLKRCPGDGCPHTFYDASRNRTGTWCSMSVCGNRTKVRSYQSRRRAGRRS